MGLLDALKNFTQSVETEYDRRIRSASNIKFYDPTGASHHHDHAEIHNEHLEAVEVETHGNGRAMAEPTPEQQNAPREVTHH
jgi:hypothetical protein